MDREQLRTTTRRSNGKRLNDCILHAVAWVAAILFLAGSAAPVSAVDSVVVFNEINYHPSTNEAANEWIELHNQMSIDIDLSGWEITGDVAYTFAEGTIIAGGGYMVIANNPLGIRATEGITNVVGPLNGRLANDSAILRLRDKNGRLMDRIEYRDGGKWPVGPDGGGVTLAKRNENAISDDPRQWASSVRQGGTPGIRNFPRSPTEIRRLLLPFNSLWRFEASGTDLGTAWAQPGFDDSGWGGRNDATLVSYWPLDGNANAVRGTTGVLVGAVSPAVDRNGAAGGALSFDGLQSQHVSIAGGGGLSGAAAGTISAWAKWSGSQDAGFGGTAGAIVGRQANGAFSDNIISLSTANPDTGLLQWRLNAAGSVNAAGTEPVGNNVWRHVVVTFSDAGSQLYVDGVLKGSGGGGALHAGSATPLTIGAWAGDGGAYFSGSIDDVAIWDRPLSPAQIAQLATQAKSPIDFPAPENAGYYAGNGRLQTFDELRRTVLPLGPTTYYFRNTFTFAGDPAQSTLALDLAANDGVVIHLNGVEVYRHNMPAGPVSYSTLALSPVGDAPLMTVIPLPTTNLVQGTNVIAVEVHQALASGDPGMVFGAGLSSTTVPAPVAEERVLVNRHDTWRYNASNQDLGATWRAAGYVDTNWPSAIAVFHGGTGTVDGVPPERVTPITATASSEYLADGRLAANVVNGAGLSGHLHSTTPGGTMWMNNGTFAAPNDLNPQITFDLGGVYPIRFIKVWNYNEFLPNRPELLARGVASGDILVGATLAGLSNFVTGQSFNIAPGTQTDFSQVIDFSGLNARFVRLDKLTNFPGGDFRFVGLSEVQFFKDVDVRRTAVTMGTTSHYFRKSFSFAGNPSDATLFLDFAADDGAVFYLNGVEIHKFNMPSSVSHGTFTTSAVINATYSGRIPVPTGSLVRGLNILAVEVHQAAAGDPDMIFGAELTALVPPPGPAEFDAGSLVFNEISAASSNAFQIELLNIGTTAVDLNGYVVQRSGRSPDAEQPLTSQSVPPGGMVVLSQPVLSFGAIAGDKLFLLRPGSRAVADSIEVHEQPRSRATGAGEWLTPAALTAGSSNSFALRNEIVLNEILYHAPPTLELPAVLATNTLVTFSNLWLYNQSGADLGTAWRSPAYDDSSWLVGTGLLYNTASALPAPKNTQLALGPTTYYFRTAFVYTGSPAILSLNLRHIVDDGAVFYLNGVEILRFNMTAGAFTYTNYSQINILNATTRVGGAIALTNLVLGTNVLAVEVHQSSSTTGIDVAFGAEITATVEAVPRTPFAESPEQWVELFNRSSNSVNLTGWRLDEGIDYRFPSNTVIAPGGYVVVAKHPAHLLAKIPGITVVGPYTNSLSHKGERIVLRDSNDNPADFVHYFDDGRWPRGPDARGSSLELRDPWADNSAAEAWMASDESVRSSWATYTYRGVATASAVGPDAQWREFVLGMLDSGEVLLDDITVVETPATTPTNLIQNSTFDTGTNKWRIIGNHHGEVIDDPDQPGNKVLRLVAGGSTDHMNNHAETTFVGARDVVNGREYQISFRAKWISGSRQLHTRLYFNRLPRTTYINAPTLHGTPGARNSRFTTNIGPTYVAFLHEPAVPAPFAPVTVAADVADPDGVTSVTLHWRKDDGVWGSTPMSGSPGSPGRFTAALSPQPGGTIVQFYVEAVDSFNARSTFPADGTNSRALVQWENFASAVNGLHNMRLIALKSDADELFRTVNLMSNERIGCTMIYDEREVFYDVGLRLKGSEHSRTTSARLGFNVSFTSEQRLRGVHDTVALDRSESTGFGQREMLIHQMVNHAGGVPTKYHDLVHIMAPRPEFTGSAELQLARYSDVFLDDSIDNGSDGTVYEYELVYQLNPPTEDGTAEGNKIPNPDSVVGTAIRNLGDDKENYRWTFLIKNNEDKDDFSRIIQFAKAMEAPAGPAFIAAITNLIDVESWLRGVAVNVLSGCGDSYGGDGSQHNVQFYARPSDGRIVYLPHDMDAFFSATRPIVPNADITKLIGEPAFARSYYSHLLDVIATTYNQQYMQRWAAHFGRLLPGQDFAAHLAFIAQRATYVAGQVNAAVPNLPFSITSSNGANFGTSNDTVTISGSAPLSVQFIEINGLRFPITWTSTTAWSVRVPLLNGPNTLLVRGLNRDGLLITNAVDTIVVTNTGAGTLLPVLINEWMADNAAPGGYADPADGLFQDWFELYNPNTNAVNLAGFFLSDNPSQPTKWQIPAGAVIPSGGFLLVWADNQVGQNTNLWGHLHAPFQLNNGGESIALYSPGIVAQHTVTFGAQSENVSQGLFPDGNTNSVYLMQTWTPRAPNMLAPLRVSASVMNGVVRLTWASIPGRTYRIEFKNDLNTPGWTQLGSDFTAISIDTTTTDPTPPPIQRFYRITQLP